MKTILKSLAIRFYAWAKKLYEENEVAKIKSRLKHCGQFVGIHYPFIIRNPQHISIGDKFFALSPLRIEAWDKYGDENFTPKITIGNNVILNANCHIGAINEITMEDNVLIGSNVIITDHSHGNLKDDIEITGCTRRLYSKGAVHISENVWIGENVAVLAGVTVGKNAVIGANSVVTSDIPANAIAAGAPARVIRIV